jgi:pimeloyl-ACP methyl ester carboxylesterase
MTSLTALGLGAAAAAASILAFRWVARTRTRWRDSLGRPPGVEWSGYVEVNGARQWLLIRGADARNPLLLFLHGGPGWPATALAGRHYSEAIERRFVVVHWEQRGAGRSFAAGGQRLTPESLLADTEAVTRWLLARFKRDKLFLVGHSWGAYLGFTAIAKHPESYSSFIAVGPLINAIENERLSLKFCLDWLDSRGKTRRKARLASLGEPPDRRPFAAIVRQRAELRRAGGMFGERYSLPKMLLDVFVSPYCGISGVWLMIRGGIYSGRCIFDPRFWQIALDRTHLRFDVPVSLFIGANDYTTPAAIADKYFELIEAPSKSRVFFESTAHMIPFEDPARFNAEVIRVFQSEGTAQAKRVTNSLA